MKKTQIVALAPVMDAGGYGENARRLLLGLHLSGRFDIQLKNYKGSAHSEAINQDELNTLSEMSKRTLDPSKSIGLSFVIAPQFQTSCKLNVGYSTFETNLIPFNWVDRCNQMDALCVPSEHNRNAFVNSGVTAKTFVVPHGATYQNSEDIKPFNQLLDKPTFLICGSIDYRKGLDIAIGAFLGTFGQHGNARLVIKTNSTDEISIRLIKEIVAKAREVYGASAGEVLLIAENYDRAKLARLYKSSTALLLPSRGEGWGLTGSEAASLGVPVIATKWSGPMMYIPTEEYGYHIDGKLVRVSGMDMNPQFEIAQAEGHMWAEPSISSLSDKMLEVINNQEEAKSRARMAMNLMQSKYTWDNSVNTLSQVLEGLVR